MSLPIQKAVFNIVTTILIMGGYVLYVFGINGETNIPKIEELEFWGKFMLMIIGVTIVAKIILMIIYSIFRAARHGDEENIDFMDERDKLIEMKSERNGNFLFIFGLMMSMIPAAMGYPVQYMFIILISSGFLSGILGDALKIYYYNRGI
jgi:biotin transporter BioY